MTTTKLTVEDLHATLLDDRHLGFGYSYCEHLSPGTRERVDRAVVAVANELGLDRETLFHWSNSKYGRWLYDAVYGRSEPPTRTTVRELLNPEAVAAATEGVVSAPLRQTAQSAVTRRILHDRLGRLVDDLHEEARRADADDDGAVPADFRAAADIVAEIRKEM